MPTPQQTYSGEALISLAAHKINQRESDTRTRDQRFREGQELAQRVLLLTSEIADITEAIKSGGSWPPPQVEGAPVVEAPPSKGPLPPQPV